MLWFKKLVKDQKGSSIILVGVTLAGLLAMTGLIVDMGGVFAAKSQLQKAANAAALSAAQELTHNETAVIRVVDEVLAEHEETDSLMERVVEMEQRVSVRLERSVPLVFSALFGWEEIPVAVKATAQLANMAKAAGVAPLGIDDSIPLEFGKPYKLKVDEINVDTGYFGVLALGGSGASTYEENLKYGYQDEISIGQIIETQTGNIVNKTKVGVDERIQNCPYPVEETYHRDCSRVILVPVYTPYNLVSNQMKSVKVTGFAYFYITDPMDNQDKTINGIFIKRTGTGYTDPAASNKGAYTIRLTE